jgi:release factor glutamine methyltransferase
VTRTVQAVLADGIAQLQRAGIDGAARDGRLLMAAALGVDAGRLVVVLPDPMPDAAADRFDDFLTRRVARAPVSHIVGRRRFFDRVFEVTPQVLDPRPETETLIVAALVAPYERVLDLGTGSGCILLTLLAERQSATGIGTDLSQAALDVAARNRTALRLDDRARLCAGSWFGAVPKDAGQFDLIVSNPPYIAAGEMAGLAPEVRDHEPRDALTDGSDGLLAYHAITAGIAGHLAPGGRLLVEIGATQGGAVAGLFAAAGLHDVAVLPDMDGRDRVVSGIARIG